MRKFTLVLLSVLLLVVALPAFAQSDELDADCVAYLDQRQEDVAAIGKAFDGKVSDLYILLYTTRHTYEDMTDVPACAERLHTLTIQMFAANQDVVGLNLVLLGDEELALDLSVELAPRIQRILTDVQTELEALKAQGWDG